MASVIVCATLYCTDSILFENDALDGGRFEAQVLGAQVPGVRC